MRRLIASLLVLCALSACSTSRHVERRSSLMSYLDRMQAPRPNPDVRLQLPLRVGVAFVPPEPVHGRFGREVQTASPPDPDTRRLMTLKNARAGRHWGTDITVSPPSSVTLLGGYQQRHQ